MNITKNSHKFVLSEEVVAALEGFSRKGEWKIMPLTDEDVRAHARAKAALEEIEENPWVEYGYDGEYRLRPLEPRREFVPTETHEEYMERFRKERNA